MRKVLVFSVVAVALLLNVGVAVAEGEYAYVIIPKLGVSESIQSLKYQSGERAWPEPGDLVAWCLVPDSYPGQKDCLQAIHLRHDLGAHPLDGGDMVYLYEEGKLHQLRVFKTEIVSEEREPLILSIVGSDIFVLIAPHPTSGLITVVWLESAYGWWVN